jgi:hypothetical protein
MSSPFRTPSLASALLVAGLALLAIAAQPLAAQVGDEARAELRGVVVDQKTGTPVVGAYVGLDNRITRTFTDERGRFLLRGLPAGPVALIVEQLGYEAWGETRTLAGGITTDLRIELVPDPVILPQISVYSDRLRTRRNALATSVHAYDAAQLVSSPALNAMEFVQGRAVTPVRCPSYIVATYCILRRGQLMAPRIFVDDVPYPPGLETLQLFDTFDVWLIEVLSSGAQIRLYTKAFAERLALGKERLFPVIF